MTMEIEFYGAADRVTGSCHILNIDGHRVLFDCGMIQGSRAVQALNYEPFPFKASSVDAVVLSHAHIDHCGRLPLLVKRGFKGPIYCQNATLGLAEILLEDSARIHEEDHRNAKRWAIKNNKKKVKPLLFGQKAAKATLGKMVGLKYQQIKAILPGVKIRFQDAGHIIGSAIVEVWVESEGVSKKFVFSGDLGQYDSPILNDPGVIKEADLVLMESTYGNRLHRSRTKTIEEIGQVIQEAHEGGGNILIPAFAVGRSQEILYQLGRHYKDWGLERWQIFLNSPMAIKASGVYWDYPHLYDEETARFRGLVEKLPPIDNLHFTRTASQSKAINKVHDHAIIIAGSGMMNAGRILHSLKRNVSRKESHLVIVGYQGQGTLGRQLVDGKKTIRIHGQELEVKIQVHTVGGLSAHGDQQDLLRWLAGFTSRPKICLVHGEDQAEKVLAKEINKKFGFQTEIGLVGNKIDLMHL